MKKLLLLALTAFGFVGTNAQVIWSENFDAVTNPNLPAGWTQYNGDNLTVNSNLSAYSFGTNAWVSRKPAGSTNGFAVSTSWYSSAGTSNDWMITPQVTPTAGAWLLFDAVAPDGNFADGYQVKISTTGNNYTDFTAAPVYTVASEGQLWATKAVNLSNYVGQPIYIAFINNSNDKYLLFLDNIQVKVLPANDGALLDMTPDIASYRSFATVGSPVAVQGLFQNQGSATVTSYTVKVNDGSTTQSYPQTANVLPYGTHIFSLNYNMPSTGIKPIKMWAEVGGDNNHVNDSTSSEFGGATFTPTPTVVFEEATGTWCGWCPRGAVYMDSIAKMHPEVVAIAVHNNDPMTVAAYDAGIGDLVGGYPSGVVGRKVEADPSEFFTAYNDHKNDFSVGDITVGTPTITGSTMTVKADVKMAVNTKPNYDYRVALVVTEDGMTGTAASWAQANYYSGAAAPNLVGAGHNWDNEPNPVPASSMEYDHVARDIMGGFTGVAGSLPATMTAGTTYSYTFNWTIPAGFRPWMAKANVLLISGLSGEVQNGKWVNVKPASVDDVNAVNDVKVFPNPTSNYLNLEFTMNTTSDVLVTMTDITGKTVYSQNLNNLNGNQGLVIPTGSMTDGIYVLSVKTKEGTSTQKVTVRH
ncbi:MAG: choice-of-anchor J domain-containing protein [Chitinophagaceae bacterium]|nr:choice-of-anchor J domain-containing protein [Chitinophagaceae bacterium]